MLECPTNSKLCTYGKVCLFYEKHSINIILNFGTKNMVEQHGNLGLKIQNYESEKELCSKEQKG